MSLLPTNATTYICYHLSQCEAYSSFHDTVLNPAHCAVNDIALGSIGSRKNYMHFEFEWVTHKYKWWTSSKFVNNGVLNDRSESHRHFEFITFKVFAIFSLSRITAFLFLIGGPTISHLKDLMAKFGHLSIPLFKPLQCF